MLDKLFRFTVHKYLHVVGCLIVAFGLPMNKVLMSIGTIWLISNVLLEGDFKLYKENLKKNPIFWCVFLLALFHFLGLLWTSDFTYALNDIRVKLPFFILPIALIARTIERRYWIYPIYAFLFSLLITSLLNVWFYFGAESSQTVDIRYLSHFGSHIRYGILVVFGAGISLMMISWKNGLTFLWLLLFSWFTYYTLIAQVMTAYVAYFFTLLGLLLVYFLMLKNKRIKQVLIVLYTATLIFGSYQMYQFFKPENATVAVNSLATQTKLGNKYYHDTTSTIMENGHHLMLYIAEGELKKAWEERSSLPFDGKDIQGQSLKRTLLRYMTSKGLKKDAEGLSQLSDWDIANVENGIASINVANGHFFYRLDGIKRQIQYYSLGYSPSGQTLPQRIEHWKAARHIIKNNFLIGVGTGDVQHAFNEAYETMDSPLDEKYYNRSHNQFLTFWVSFGVFGFLIFLVLWFFTFKQTIINRNWIGLCFAFIAFTSCLPEDTLETQQGVTFVGFFLGYLPFLKVGGKSIVN